MYTVKTRRLGSLSSAQDMPCDNPAGANQFSATKLALVGWVALSLGGLLAVVNFYLSFLRYPAYRLCGGNALSFKRVSGVPAEALTTA